MSGDSIIKMTANLPVVSTIIVTYNSAKTIRDCLSSILQQDYERSKLDIIIIDGGSTDDTLKIIESFNLSPLQNNLYKDDPEKRKAIGIQESKGELILFIDSDNVIPSKTWLKKMVLPLLDNNIIASQPLRFEYDKSHPAMVRYFALIGIGDPVAYYLGKSDHLSWKDDPRKFPGFLIDKGDYYEVTFDEFNLPTIGANGFLIRKEILLKANCTPENFFHIDVNLDLVRLGYNKYALIKDSIIHLSGNSIIGLLKRRLIYMKKYRNQPRRYLIYSSARPSDKMKLLKYVIYSLTLIKPLADSLNGYRRIHDVAWFIHPVICFCTLFVYSLAIIQQKTLYHRNTSTLKASRQ